ncbi:flagellar hook-length control protein FliK [Dehalobacter sp. DCM]|uniref:flagellar hook-length control protein FliK n=1 Tax=Dehalobacter sp. DCM TaxID=2907827 RepID=UPI003081AD29|nr:flagellar hook-length control protein FliK [Dehalobacter sp. DCM]
MNIASVPQPKGSEELKTNSSAADKGSKGSGMEQDSLLFALFLQNCLSQDAVGQTPTGELSDDADGDVSPEQGDSIIGQNAFVQVLQNLFPAGMEATSGSIGDHNSTLLTDLTLGADGIDMMSLNKALESFASTGINGQTRESLTNGEGLKLGNYLKAFGLQGIDGSKAHSLDPAELDKYNTTMNYLKELSGTITTETELKAGSQDNPAAAIALLQVIAGKSVSKSNDNQATGSIRDDLNAAEAAAEVSGTNALNAVSSSTTQTAANNEQSSDKANDTMSSVLTAQAGNKTEMTTDMIDEHALDTDALSSGKVWDQVLDALKKQDIRSAEINTLSIQLQPQELGKMDITMHLKDGQLHLVINASEQATGALIQNSLQDLREGLADIGVTCGSMELGNQSNHQTPKKGHYRYTEALDTPLQEEDMTISPIFTSYLNPYAQSGRINVSV